MASIYDTVPNWSAATTYNKFNIVIGSDGRYYYSVINSNQNKNPTSTSPSYLGSTWDGYISLNNVLYPNFWWKPSYNGSIQHKPKLKINQFGNGYQQRLNDGINNDLIELNLSFQNRSELETVSILHFLKERNGQQSFVYNIPTIYSKSSNDLTTKFTSFSWNASYVSYNNYNIEVDLTETPV